MVALAVFAQGDKACQRGYGRTQTADIYGDEQVAVIRRKA